MGFDQTFFSFGFTGLQCTKRVRRPTFMSWKRKKSPSRQAKPSMHIACLYRVLAVAYWGLDIVFFFSTKR